MTWQAELDLIWPTARQYGVDPMLIAAIRVAEHGGPGIEFGSEDPSATDYGLQLLSCVRTVRNFLAALTAPVFELCATGRGHRALRLNQTTVSALGHHYAPEGAHNDPHQLNANWVDNVWYWYDRWTRSADLSAPEMIPAGFKDEPRAPGDADAQ